MKTLSFWLGSQVIAIAPVPFSRLATLQILIEELTGIWEKLGGDTTSLFVEYKMLVQQVSNLFPRLDTPPQPPVYGWDVSLMSADEIQEMFLCRIEGEQVSPGKLLALHQSDAAREIQQTPPQEGDDIDTWNPPIKSCGNAEIDSIGQLMTALGATDTLALYDRFDLGTINLLIQAYNASQESPEDRRKQYLAESYQKYKEQNPDIINKALGLDRINDEFDFAKIFAEKMPNLADLQDE